MGEHWTPASYLKHFSINNDDYISVVNLKARKTIIKENVKNIASENNYNECEKLKKTTLENIENNLSKIEGDFEKICSKIKGGIFIFNYGKKNFSILDDSEKEKISEFIGHQAFRTKKIRNALREKTPYFEYNNFRLEIKYRETAERDDETKFQHLVTQSNFANILKNELMNCHWKIIINCTDKSFITSDAPILFIGGAEENKISFMHNETNILIFPLYPNILLEITSLNNYPKKDVQFVNNMDYIKCINDLECKNAEYFIVFKNPAFVSLNYNGRYMNE